MRLGPRLAASSATASSKSKVAACTGHADQLHCRAASGLASDVPSGQTGKTVAGCQFEVASVSEVSLLLVTADRVASQVPPSHSNRHSRKCSCPLLSSFSPRLLRVHPLELHRGEPPSPDTADEEEAGAEIVEVRSLFRTFGRYAVSVCRWCPWDCQRPEDFVHVSNRIQPKPISQIVKGFNFRTSGPKDCTVRVPSTVSLT